MTTEAPEESGVEVYRTERIREDRFEADDPAAGASVVAMVLVKSFGIADASNGPNITAKLQIDSAYSQDFEELMGEQTYIFRVGKKDYGECQVIAVASKTDADNRAQTTVGLRWSATERKRAKEIFDLVGTSARLELWGVQLTTFGAKAEATPEQPVPGQEALPEG